MGHPRDPFSIAQRLTEGLSQDYGYVFHDMMAVRIACSGGRHHEIEGPVAGELRQHVVQHGDAGVYLVTPAPIEADLDGYIGLTGGPLERCGSISHRTPLLWSSMHPLTMSVCSGCRRLS